MSPGEASTKWGEWETRVTSCSVLEQVEARRHDTTHTISLGDPNVEGWGLYYYLDGRRVDLSFAGHRVNVATAYDDEFAFDADGFVWVEGDTERYNVRLAGYGHAAFSTRKFVGTGRPVYEMPYSHLPERFDLVGILKPSRRRQRKEPLSRPYRACKELASWLGLTDEEITEIVGARRTTLYSWKRGTEPRKRTARRLYQLHGTVRALRNVLGGEGLRSWLSDSRPRPLSLLEQGKQDEFERLADAMIFPRERTPRRRLDAAWSPEAGGRTPPAATDDIRKRASKVRSRRLGR